jgi:hypothetical protein
MNKTDEILIKAIEEITDRIMTTGSIIGVEYYKKHSLAWKTERKIFTERLVALITKARLDIARQISDILFELGVVFEGDLASVKDWKKAMNRIKKEARLEERQEALDVYRGKLIKEIKKWKKLEPDGEYYFSIAETIITETK